MKTQNILSIGNSFSTDATAYLHQIAARADIGTLVVNLYIGGCSLQSHWENIKHNRRDYTYEKNGLSTGEKVAIKSVLLQEDWDIITLQQASRYSGLSDSYRPYIDNIYNYFTELCPASEIVIHQTWAYEKDSTHEGFANYNYDQERMYQSLCAAYQRVCNLFRLRLIPCGDSVQSVRARSPFIYENGGISLCRDGFHLDKFYGRYLAAATWFEFLLKGNILENDFIPPLELSANKKTAEPAIQVIKECVHKTVLKHR